MSQKEYDYDYPYHIETENDVRNHSCYSVDCTKNVLFSDIETSRLSFHENFSQ